MKNRKMEIARLIILLMFGLLVLKEAFDISFINYILMICVLIVVNLIRSFKVKYFVIDIFTIMIAAVPVYLMLGDGTKFDLPFNIVYLFPLVLLPVIGWFYYFTRPENR